MASLVHRDCGGTFRLATLSECDVEVFSDGALKVDPPPAHSWVACGLCGFQLVDAVESKAEAVFRLGQWVKGDVHVA